MRRSVLQVLALGSFLIAPVLNADVMSVGSATESLASNFDIPVTISGATDLYAFQFDLSFDPEILQLQSVTEGPFLPSGGSTFFVPGTIDNVAGTATFNADTLIGSIPGVVGDGTITFLNFTAVGNGTSALNLANVILLDSNLNELSFTTTSGQVMVGQVPEANSVWLFLTVISVLWMRPIQRLRR